MALHCLPPCLPIAAKPLVGSDCFPCGTGGGTVDPFELAITCPTIPSTAVVLSPDVPVRVIGQNFTIASKVFFDNVEQTTTFVTTGELTFVVQPSAEPVARTATITVKDGATTAKGTCQFSFTAAPVLSVTCPLVPATAVIGAPDLQVIVNGQLFTAASEVLWDGVPVNPPATLGGSTSLTFTVKPSLEAAARTAIVSVRDGASTAATTCPFAFTAVVVAVPPTVTSVDPECVALGGATNVTVKVFGTDFLPTSVVNFNGAPQATIYSSATELHVSIAPATMLAHEGVHQVTVSNAGAVSTPAIPLTYYALPTLTSAAPSMLPTNNTALQTVTLTGTNFVAGARVFYYAEEQPVVSVTPTVITITRDPAAVGNESGPLVVRSCERIVSNDVTVQSNANPTLNLLDPVSGPVGTTVSVYAEHAGSGTDATVLVNGAPVATVMAGNIPTFVVAAGMAGVINVSVRTYVGNGDADVVAAPLTLPFTVI